MNQPSEATKLKIAEFFMKTSVPRILADMERLGIDDFEEYKRMKELQDE